MRQVEEIGRIKAMERGENFVKLVYMRMLILNPCKYSRLFIRIWYSLESTLSIR